MTAAAATTKMHTRTLHLTNPHMKGDDVKAAQKLLKAHGYYTGPLDGIFSAGTGNACKKAKYVLGYASKDIKATYGHPLNGLLAGTIKLPAAYKSRAILRRKSLRKHLGRVEAIRLGVVKQLKWMLNPAIKKSEHYAQLRPIDGEGLQHKRELPLYFDCSGSGTVAYSWTPGAPDPNDENFNGEGYTGTLLNACRHIMPHEVRKGDPGVLGAYPGEHAIWALEDATEQNNYDPLVFSMGREGDPNPYRASVIHAAFAPGTVLQWLTPHSMYGKG